MSQRVDIEGVGPVEFPDGMPQADMAHAIENELLPGLKSGALKLGGATAAAVSAAPAPPEPSLFQKLDTGARGINMGIPFTDRLTAGYETLPLAGSGKSYDENLANEQAMRAQFQQEHPGRALVGQTVGGLLTALALPGSVAAKGGLLSALMAGARTGAVYGGAQGVSDQPDLTNAGNDLGGALKGAAEGATLGSVFSGLGYGAGRAGGAIATRFTREPVEGNWGATKNLMNAYQRDQVPPGSPSDFGPDGMMLDTGPAMLNLAKDTSATTQGSSIRTAVSARGNAVDRDISQALPGIIGPDQSALAAAAALKADRSEAGKALQPVFANAPQVDVTPVFDQIDQMMNKLPSGSAEQLALAKVQRLLVDKPAQAGAPATRAPVLGPQGQVIRYESTPAVPYTPAKLVTDAQTLDNAKRAIDGLINFGDSTIGLAPGALASKNSSLKMAAGGVNEALRGQVPGYGDTMDALSGLARQVEGIQYGRELLDTGKNAIHPGNAAAKISGLPSAERDAVRTGVNSEIYRMAGAPANGTALDALNAVLPGAQQTGGRWSAAKLAQLFEPSQIDALTNLRQQGNQFHDAAKAIGGTVPQAPESISPLDAVLMAHDAASGPTGWARLALKSGASRMRPDKTTAQNDALTRALTAGGDAKDSIAATLGDLLARRLAAQNAGRALAPVFTGIGLGAFDH